MENWDKMLRVACSLKSGWVTASTLISRFQAQPRKGTTARALQEYGRLLKTLFILQWIDSEDLRRRICRQLNVGESMHALRRFLFFGNEGRIVRSGREEQGMQAECLNLITNAVVVWNTVYMHHIINHFVTAGDFKQGLDVSHLSPAQHEHINPYGKIRFAMDGAPMPGRLRPLNDPRSQVAV